MRERQTRKEKEKPFGKEKISIFIRRKFEEKYNNRAQEKKGKNTYLWNHASEMFDRYITIRCLCMLFFILLECLSTLDSRHVPVPVLRPFELLKGSFVLTAFFGTRLLRIDFILW